MKKPRVCEASCLLRAQFVHPVLPRIETHYNRKIIVAALMCRARRPSPSAWRQSAGWRSRSPSSQLPEPLPLTASHSALVSESGKRVVIWSGGTSSTISRSTPYRHSAFARISVLAVAEHAADRGHAFDGLLAGLLPFTLGPEVGMYDFTHGVPSRSASRWLPDSHLPDTART